MKKYFSVGEAAKAADTTSETLRHYDRIGLVRPSFKDEKTNYRYYTDRDIVRINTVRALHLMDLSLREIKKVLEYDDLEKIVEFLERAEKKADEKIAALRYSKSKIELAKADYKKKLNARQNIAGIFCKELPKRVILLSDTLETPTLDNLWNYLSHFYGRLPDASKDMFTFEDQAGIYTENGSSKMFAVCTRYTDVDGLKILPEGKYLCADCTEDNRAQTLRELTDAASAEYGTVPAFTVQLVMVSGILQWNYELQLYIG